MPRTAAELLGNLKADGFEFQLRDGNVAVRRADRSPVPAFVLAELRRHDAEIRAMLTAAGEITSEPEATTDGMERARLWRSARVGGDACRCDSCRREDFEERDRRLELRENRWRVF